MFAIIIMLPLFSLTAPIEPIAAAPTPYPTGSPVIGTLDYNNPLATITFEVVYTGLYKLNTTATSTGDTESNIDVSINSITSNYDPVNNRIKQGFTNLEDQFMSAYPNQTQFRISYFVIIAPRNIQVQLQLGSLHPNDELNYTLLLTRLSDLDANEAPVGVQNNLTWTGEEIGYLYQFDISTAGFYNLTYEQNVSNYLPWVSAVLRIQASTFNASEDQLEVIFNGNSLGNISGPDNYIPVPYNYILFGASNNVTVLYTNLTGPSPPVDLYVENPQILMRTEDGSLDSSTFGFADNMLDFSDDTETGTQSLIDFTLPAYDDMDVNLMVTDASYGNTYVYQQISDNDSISMPFYFPASRYYLYLDREYRANMSIAFSAETLPTQFIDPGESVLFDYNTSNWPSGVMGGDFTNISYVVISPPADALFNISAEIFDGINWTVMWMLYSPVGMPFILGLESDNIDYYMHSLSRETGLIAIESINSQWATGRRSASYIGTASILGDDNGSISISPSQGNLMHTAIPLIVFPMPSDVFLMNPAYAPSINVTFSLNVSSSIAIDDARPGYTNTVSGFNTTVGPIQAISTLDVVVGTEYTINITPTDYTSYGYVNVTILPSTLNDWLVRHMPDFTPSTQTLTVSDVNSSIIIEYTPSRSGKLYIVTSVFDSFGPPYGDVTNLSITVTSVAAEGLSSQTATFDERDQVVVLSFDVGLGATYEIEFLSDEGMLLDSGGSPTYCTVALINPDGYSQFDSTEEGVLEFYGSSSVTITYVARYTGKAYIILVGEDLDYGSVTVTVNRTTLMFSPITDLLLGLGIGLPVGMAAGILALWTIKKGQTP
ncbi:MAG: hypothetical protein ACFE7S_04200 [Candidatus Hodarchaeota archaeon]